MFLRVITSIKNYFKSKNSIKCIYSQNMLGLIVQSYYNKDKDDSGAAWFKISIREYLFYNYFRFYKIFCIIFLITFLIKNFAID